KRAPAAGGSSRRSRRKPGEPRCLVSSPDRSAVRCEHPWPCPAHVQWTRKLRQQRLRRERPQRPEWPERLTRNDASTYEPRIEAEHYRQHVISESVRQGAECRGGRLDGALRFKVECEGTGTLQ